MNDPTRLHERTERCLATGDLDGLVALYEPGAVMIGPEGLVTTGADAIRDNWATVLAFGGTVSMSTRHVVVSGELALLSNDWVLTVGDVTVTGRTAEVARRGDDGEWRYVIDHPTAADDLVPA